MSERIELIGGCRDGAKMAFDDIPGMIVVDCTTIPPDGMTFTMQSDYADCYYYVRDYFGRGVFLVDYLYERFCDSFVFKAE